MSAVLNHQAPARDQYILGHTQGEYERLIRQAEVWERATRQALRQVGLGAGDRALDVGCGPCDAMRLMAECVGPEGQVTGIDINGELGRHAIDRLNQTGPAIHNFVHGDISQMTRIEGGPFDLVFARLLLFHLRDPVATLRLLWRSVRMGGVLMIMDYDTTVMRSEPQIPAVERAMRLCNDTFRRNGRDIEVGVRMPGMFMEAGVGVPDACVVSSVMLPAHPSISMMRNLLTSLRPQIVQHRLSEVNALDRLDGELQLAAGSDSFMRWPDLIATWKRRTR
ncbi:MAG TPA: class I SAM-dependent methyltransferase [Povalibacter sp.]|nr:class I SAM-dependent methyltransferase [Povalibacter sp.]